MKRVADITYLASESDLNYYDEQWKRTRKDLENKNALLWKEWRDRYDAEKGEFKKLEEE